MGKAETKKAEQDASSQGQQELGMQQQAFGKMSGLSDTAAKENQNIFKVNPFADAKYTQNANRLITDSLDSNEQNVEDTLTNYSRRTGTNSANMASTAKELSRERARDLTSATSGRLMNDYAKWQSMRMNAADNEGKLAGEWSSPVGSTGSAATGALNEQGQLAKQPGFWSQFGQSLLRGGTAAAGAFAGQ